MVTGKKETGALKGNLSTDQRYVNLPSPKKVKGPFGDYSIVEKVSDVQRMQKPNLNAVGKVDKIGNAGGLQASIGKAVTHLEKQTEKEHRVKAFPGAAD
jgi:hypothetical protein